jgi:hypothetical protein
MRVSAIGVNKVEVKMNISTDRNGEELGFISLHFGDKNLVAELTVEQFKSMIRKALDE